MKKFIINYFNLNPINKDQIDYLSSNPEITDYIINNGHPLNIKYLCKNPSKLAIDYIKENININYLDIDWKELSKNKGAIEILESNIENINWETLMYNYKAI